MDTLADTRLRDEAAADGLAADEAGPARADEADERERAETERELRLVDAAIALVHAGAAVRVTVANLRLARGVEEAARARAELRGLKVTATFGDLGEANAVVIERDAAR